MIKNFEIQNDLSQISVLASTVESFFSKNNIIDDIILDINLALEELVVNIISYAFDDQHKHLIYVSLRIHEAKYIEIIIKDAGKEFNPLDIQAPDLDALLEDRGIGGCGIHLVRTLMDEVEYKREDGNNISTIRKKINN
ncbi:ATP-binding protein [bacterium]